MFFKKQEWKFPRQLTLLKNKERNVTITESDFMNITHPTRLNFLAGQPKTNYHGYNFSSNIIAEKEKTIMTTIIMNQSLHLKVL